MLVEIPGILALGSNEAPSCIGRDGVFVAHSSFVDEFGGFWVYLDGE
jgi:hypothetical protein